MFIFLLCLILILFCLYIYKISIKYRESSYYKITNNSLLSLLFNSGKYGEYKIYQTLKGLENSTTKFLFNLYIPTYKNNTTEIDIIIISTKGIFVLESKNYSGWIFGNETKKYWTQTLLSYKHKCIKNHFYNPIKQNNTHIKYLKKILNNQNYKYYSLVIFANQCKLKTIENKTNTKVLYLKDLYSHIYKIFQEEENTLSKYDIDIIFNYLYKYTQVDLQTKTKHIKNINQYKQ